jgi:CMP-2-keto-3-deoxyoctulosonic acid synthetase
MVQLRMIVFPSCLDLQRGIALTKITKDAVGAALLFSRSWIPIFVESFVVEVN